MTEPQDDKTRTQRLMRYADGEADGAESIEMLRRMASDPDTARAAAHQQQLKDAVARAAAAGAPPAAEALRERIARLAAETPIEDAGPIARIGFAQRWGPAIAAAVLVAVSLGVYMAATGPAAPHPEFQTIGGMHAAKGLLSTKQLARYAGRHAKCSVDPAKLHHEQMPKHLERVSDAVLEHLHVKDAALPGLDLSQWGYTFAGAGQCMIPGDPSVHLVYHAATGISPALSLWMCPDDGRFDIPESAVYRVIDQAVEHPMAVWRNGGIIYYLVGDDPEPVDRIAGKLGRPALTLNSWTARSA